MIAAFTTVIAAGASLAAVSGGLGSAQDPGNGIGSAKANKAPRPTGPPPRLWDRNPDSIAAVGDSITRGFHACALLSDCPDASWVTGANGEVRSLASRLDIPKKRTWNFANTGSRVSELSQQMRKAAKQKPDLITVLAGANDACTDRTAQMTSTADFRNDVRTAFRELRRVDRKAHVYVASVPNLKRLWAEGRKSNFGIGKEVWRLGICQSMLKDPNSQDKAAKDRRTQVHDRVVAYNRVLRAECRKDRRCRYDGGSVHGYRFSGSQLSKWDTFHPNKKGQRELAALAHRKITARGEAGR
ncbi:SGNH/GDSL hydrolase family protein [Streptomyces sp. AJS327]|uniref:SGNH/GDSL hydrolase family protein n=1 Tax=Streptomyces sp. AJS327 TaxID=2545265 RepID=UPI0015DFBE3F|nr:SGNH/GDSL hydrolase family protein [Streptomyces sp. AJS327]MBA0049981.1 SGNH/GDSL hydrolase family protein [Streptomyces sp. AJS327]